MAILNLIKKIKSFDFEDECNIETNLKYIIYGIHIGLFLSFFLCLNIYIYKTKINILSSNEWIFITFMVIISFNLLNLTKLQFSTTFKKIKNKLNVFIGSYLVCFIILSIFLSFNFK